MNLVKNQALNLEASISEPEPQTTKNTKKEGNDDDIKPPLNASCFICLSEPMMDPFVLQCGHAFCFSCLQNWQAFCARSSHHYDNNHNNTQAPSTHCPACRKAAPNIVQSIHETALLYAARANNRNLDSSTQTQYSRKALAELDKVDLSAAIDSRQKLQHLFTKAEILHQLDRPVEALKIIDQVQGLLEEGTRNHATMNELITSLERASLEGRRQDFEAIHQQLEEQRDRGVNLVRIGAQDTLEMYLNMAEYQEAAGDYEGAKETYKFKIWPMMDDHYTEGHPNANTATPIQQRKLFMGMSRCMYHLGDYQLAIDLGESAIQMNRYFPQVHKYVALSHAASGNLEAAIRTMGRAVCYETPWDEVNKSTVLAMYQDLKEKQKHQDNENTAKQTQTTETATDGG